MSTSQTHIIRKQVLEIDGPSQASRQYWEETIRQHYYGYILPQLEAEFNKLTDPNEYVQLDKLVIEVEADGAVPDEAQLEKVFQQVISQAVQKVSRSVVRNTKSSEKRAIDCLVYFLKYGLLPWWAETLRSNALQTAMSELANADVGRLYHFMEGIHQDPTQLKRFLAHCPEDILQQIIARIGKEQKIYQQLALVLHNVEMPISVWEILMHTLFEFPGKGLGETTILNSFLHRVEKGVGTAYVDAIVRNLAKDDKFLKEIGPSDRSSQIVLQLAKAIRQYVPDDPNAGKIWCILLKQLSQNPIKEWAISVKKALEDLAKDGYHQLRILAVLMQYAFDEKLAAENLRRKYFQDLQELIRLLRKMGWENQWTGFEENRQKGENRKLNELHTGAILSLLSTFKDLEGIQDWLDQHGMHGIEALLNQSPYSRLSVSVPQKPKKEIDPFDDSDSVFIHYAGIVLLAPFLARFFEQIGLTKDHEFLNEAAQQRAAYMLYYLASGNTAGAEFFFPLMKLLVGLGLSTPLEFEVEISEQEKEEAQKLLEAILLHAQQVLGAISPETFRASFLQRKAALSSQGNHWHLRVERKGQDALLSKLPWGFQVVKLPWMDAHIVVEW